MYFEVFIYLFYFFPTDVTFQVWSKVFMFSAEQWQVHLTVIYPSLCKIYYLNFYVFSVIKCTG